MIIYSVTVIVQPDVEAEWLDWMSRVHVADVLSTGCFTQCRMHKVLGSPADEPTFVMHYECATIEDYERYRGGFAAALQKDHSDRFGAKVRGSRQLLEQMLRVPRPN